MVSLIVSRCGKIGNLENPDDLISKFEEKNTLAGLMFFICHSRMNRSRILTKKPSSVRG